MNSIFRTSPSRLSGTVSIPGSKSQTIRALAFALLADGTSCIRNPLYSSDTEACIKMILQFGASAERNPADGSLTVTGTGGKPAVPENIIDICNSGTSLFIGTGLASLLHGYAVFTGDSSIRRRSAENLLSALNQLGGRSFSCSGSGCPPLVAGGPVSGGQAVLDAVTSQYLTALLIALPCAAGDSVITLSRLNEKPYIDMTLDWLKRQNIFFENHNYSRFFIKGGQKYSAFEYTVPADFSSAVFFLEAAAVTGSELVLEGLDFSDFQGDREVFSVFRQMGIPVHTEGLRTIIRPGHLKGGVFDLNGIPDALPALAVAACFAEGETRLVNAAQARIKETDRIGVMCHELSKLGADISELPDGLVIHGTGGLSGGRVSGHGDHRVVMALAAGGLACREPVEVDTAQAAAVTFPGFMDLMCAAGAEIQMYEEED